MTSSTSVTATLLGTSDDRLDFQYFGDGNVAWNFNDRLDFQYISAGNEAWNTLGQVQNNMIQSHKNQIKTKYKSHYFSEDNTAWNTRGHDANKMLIEGTEIDTGLEWDLTGMWTNFNYSLRIVFETKKTRFFDLVFPFSQIPGMGGRQNTQQAKQKQKHVNNKHAHRSQQQQHAVQAHESNNTELTDGMDVMLNEGKYNDLTDGRYEKTIFVKTWTGRTVSLETDLDHAVETVKRQLEAKTGIPKDHQHLTSRGKVLMDNRTLKDYYISRGETIELSALLLGGMKNKSLSPAPMRTDREKKRKESEPHTDASGWKKRNRNQHPNKRQSKIKIG